MSSTTFDNAVKRLYEPDNMSICTGEEFARNLLAGDPASMALAERDAQVKFPMNGDPSKIFGRSILHPSYVDILKAARRTIPGVQISSDRARPDNRSKIATFWRNYHAAAKQAEGFQIKFADRNDAKQFAKAIGAGGLNIIRGAKVSASPPTHSIHLHT
jgi:hypothetical protein